MVKQNLRFKNLFKSLFLGCLFINFTNTGFLEYLGCRRAAPKSRVAIVTLSGAPETEFSDKDYVGPTMCTRSCCARVCRQRIKPAILVTGASMGNLALTEKMMQDFRGKSYIFNVDNSMNQFNVSFTVGMTLLGYIRAQKHLAEQSLRERAKAMEKIK